MAEPALEIERLEYRYPGARRDRRSPASTCGSTPGEFVVLAGRSGSGKSTLLRAGVRARPALPRRRDRRVEIRSAAARPGRPAPPSSRRRSASSPRSPRRRSSRPRSGPSSSCRWSCAAPAPVETARAVEEAALALAIEPLLDRTTDSLSGGELQRVALGAALVTGPPLLLLDEPTSQLDPVAGDELIALLRRLNEEWGVTVLLGEHRLERCLAAADRVVALDGGRLVYDGSPARLRPSGAPRRLPSSPPR